MANPILGATADSTIVRTTIMLRPVMVRMGTLNTPTLFKALAPTGFPGSAGVAQPLRLDHSLSPADAVAVPHRGYPLCESCARNEYDRAPRPPKIGRAAGSIAVAIKVLFFGLRSVEQFDLIPVRIADVGYPEIRG
jgi:hypothetical protein